MSGFLLKVADTVIGVKPLTDELEIMVRRYVVTEGTPSFDVEITPADLEKEAELLALQRKVTEGLIERNVLLFHSSLAAVDGFGYAYAAPSGTGKSTHTALLRKVYGDRVTMVNDDKPFIRVEDGAVYAYGSPWAGKTHLETNTRVPLLGICFIEQGTENKISRLELFDAFVHMMTQVYMPESKEKTERTLDLIEKTLKTVPAYFMTCNMEEEAAKTSFKAMNRIRFEDILNRDGELTYKTVGNSMNPMLYENKDVVVVRKKDDTPLKKFDVILFKRPNAPNRYVLHRIVKVHDGKYDVVGDNQFRIEKNVEEGQIIGVLSSFIRDGREIPVDDPEYQRYVKRQWAAFPVRSLWLRLKHYAKRLRG